MRPSSWSRWFVHNWIVKQPSSAHVNLWFISFISGDREEVFGDINKSCTLSDLDWRDNSGSERSPSSIIDYDVSAGGPNHESPDSAFLVFIGLVVILPNKEISNEESGLKWKRFSRSSSPLRRSTLGQSPSLLHAEAWPWIPGQRGVFGPIACYSPG